MPASPTAALSLLPALQTNAWFAACPLAFQRALLTEGRLWRLADGEALFNRGAVAEGLCCVVAGALQVGAVQADGTRTLLAWLEPYQWFGEISMLDGLPRTHDAVADGDATVLVVPQPALQAWLDEHPADWRHVGRLACAKLRLLFTVLEDIQHLSLERRLAKRLCLAAQGFEREAPPRRRLRLPQEQLALMLGVSRQTVNKALGQLEAQGLLALRYGGIELLDWPGLNRLAGPPPSA